MDGIALTENGGGRQVATPEITIDENQLETVKSRLTIVQPIRKDNGIIFNCEAAVPDDVKDLLVNRAFNQSFRLSVQCK